mgnify:CR=1 FL=1
MSSKDDALRRKKKQEKLSNEFLGISNVEYEAKEKKKSQPKSKGLTSNWLLIPLKQPQPSVQSVTSGHLSSIKLIESELDLTENLIAVQS